MIFSIIEQALMALPLILGAYLTISLLKLPDFSIESAYLFGAVAAFLMKELPLPLIVLSAVGGGMLVGAIVSLLNQILRIPFLLAAIIANGLFHGLTQFCLGTSMVSFRFALPLPELAFLFCVTGCAFLLVMFVSRSQLGYSLAIYGNNPQFFSMHRQSTRYVVFCGVLLGHGCAGLGGFLFAQSNGFVDLTMNVGVILECLSALMIGKFLFSCHRPNLLIPLIGVMAFFLIQQSLLRLGLNLKYFNAFQAVIILLILAYNCRQKTATLDHLGV